MFSLHVMSLLPCLPCQFVASSLPTLCPHSAGVGRTGTLIAIDCVLDQLQEEKVVDIAGVIINLRSRTQRMKMVQSLMSECLYNYYMTSLCWNIVGAVYVCSRCYS